MDPASIMIDTVRARFCQQRGGRTDRRTKYSSRNQYTLVNFVGDGYKQAGHADIPQKLNNVS